MGFWLGAAGHPWRAERSAPLQLGHRSSPVPSGRPDGKPGPPRGGLEGSPAQPQKEEVQRFPLPSPAPGSGPRLRGQPAAEGDTSGRSMEGESGPGMGNNRMKNLQSEVEGVKNIMTQNVERILARGENLDHLRNKTEDLEATSEHFKTTSQKVARKYWWKNVKMIVIICIIVAIIILFIILFATGVIPT